eukprot:NODE_2043_length_516_cov_13.867238_g1667_i0.p6 GENE.NODE_2043_length_516_cov_13.867238_g1667_i0~~NODE_2043_length_516_cov_13.867238_g1667_i0.p6  ORF type:complete len:57 (-),score=1.02 NODE_2043_length_516_cov_13.867238_g1667_i0:204-374(-)
MPCNFSYILGFEAIETNFLRGGDNRVDDFGQNGQKRPFYKGKGLKTTKNAHFLRFS